jgi:NADH-quinone oxidoreductase subunit H
VTEFNAVSTIIFILPFFLVYFIFAVYAERKISAFIQDRLGPMEAGKFGLLQSIADGIKFIQKEDIVPTQADARLFKLAPVLVFAAVFTGFSVLPLSPTWAGSGILSGLFFFAGLRLP